MIDEKKLIEQIRTNGIPGEGFSDWERENVVVDIINSQPKIGEWIPCNEQLPKAGKRYLVSAIWKDKDFEVRRTYDAVYGNDGVWHTHNYEPVTYEVIAWQPLPEPYIGERHES